MRTHLCGEVNEQLAGQSVDLCGWVDNRRDLGGLIFISLRDRAGIVQEWLSPIAPLLPVQRPCATSIACASAEKSACDRKASGTRTWPPARLNW